MVEDIETVIEIEAPREAVWEALTAEGRVEAWMGCLRWRRQLDHVFYLQPDRTRRETGDVTDAIACRLEVLDAPRRLAFSWTFPDTPETHVSVRLRRIPGGTHVKLVHAGWDQFEPDAIQAVRDGLARAWHAVALPALKAVAEG